METDVAIACRQVAQTDDHTDLVHEKVLDESDHLDILAEKDPKVAFVPIFDEQVAQTDDHTDLLHEKVLDESDHLDILAEKDQKVASVPIFEEKVAQTDDHTDLLHEQVLDEKVAPQEYHTGIFDEMVASLSFSLGSRVSPPKIIAPPRSQLKMPMSQLKMQKLERQTRGRLPGVRRLRGA